MTAGNAAIISILTAVLTALLVGPSAAYLTAWLSLRRYQVEKWWDKKAIAYESALGGMHDIIKYYDRIMDAHVLDQNLSDEYKDPLRIKAEQGRAEIQRMARIGSFILSAGAEKILNDYETQMEVASHAPDWFEYVDTCLGVSLENFRLLRDEARRDLGVGPALPGMTWLENRIEQIKNRAGHPDLGAPNA